MRLLTDTTKEGPTETPSFAMHAATTWSDDGNGP
jgi:hypothetical protein